MAAILTLDDGRSLYSSTLGMSGMYSLIAKKILGENEAFSVWLKDVSDRPSPFLDFDLRGLGNSERQLFYKSAYKAYDELVAMYGENVLTRENAFSARTLKRLIELHESIAAGEPPESCNDLDAVSPYDGEKIIFAETWN